MKLQAKLLTLALVTVAAYNAQADTLAVAPPGNLLVRVDDGTKIYTIGKVGIDTIENTSWEVSQQGSPAPFNSSNKYVGNGFWKSGANWTLANAATSVSYDTTTYPWLNGMYQLAQNGGADPTKPVDCNHEYDLFLQPKDKNNSDFDANVPDGISESLPLASLSNVWFNLGVNIPYEQLNTCQHVSYVLGIHLWNTPLGKGYFYQIAFRDTGEAKGDFSTWDDGKSSGASDNIENINPSFSRTVPGQGRVAYSANIYGRLRALIESGKFPDKNLSSYTIRGVFFGSAMWGNSVVSSQWDNFSLVAW